MKNIFSDLSLAPPSCSAAWSGRGQVQAAGFREAEEAMGFFHGGSNGRALTGSCSASALIGRAKSEQNYMSQSMAVIAQGQWGI